MWTKKERIEIIERKREESERAKERNISNKGGLVGLDVDEAWVVSAEGKLLPEAQPPIEMATTSMAMVVGGGDKVKKTDDWFA